MLASAFGTPPNGGRDSLDGVAHSLRLADLTWGNFEETFSRRRRLEVRVELDELLRFPGPTVVRAQPDRGRLRPGQPREQPRLRLRRFGIRADARGSAEGAPALGGGRGQITILRRKGLRVAFLGFAPYPWASDLLDIPAARRLVKKAAARADLVVVAIHAGAEGSDQIHVPHGAEYFLGENRGNSRAFTHAAIDAGADLVVGSGPHVIRGVEWYHHRLIAYSTGNFAGYHNFSLGGTLSLSAIFRVTLKPDGTFVRGRWISVRLADPGLPRLDYSKSSLHLVSSLSRQDFGSHGARFSADGAIRG